jgi:tryptophan synthase alpha chain
MNRIARQFYEIRAEGRNGFIPFVTAGDPDLATSLALIRMLADEGADVIELGVPFSDPMADGPTIQASSQRALINGVSVADVLQLVRQFRSTHETPIVLFGYLNPIIQYGVERFADHAAASGVDGVLVTDIVDREADEMRTILASKSIDLISLIAPTTSDERLERIANRSTGFIYAVSHAGVTGARNEMSDAAEKLVARVRKYTDLPVAVGFGISSREQVEATWKFANAAVVGSAIVAQIEKSHSSDDLVERIREFVRGLLPRVAKTPTAI